jgi:hypothetical protein
MYRPVVQCTWHACADGWAGPYHLLPSTSQLPLVSKFVVQFSLLL